MAQTKVKLVSNGVITVDNLHTNHGITTDHIGEGTNKFFTDARVQNYLASNNYIKTTDVASLETVTSLSLSANTLSYVDEAGNTTNLDLSLYLDDTNLARLVSGTLDGATGIATFTRDDATTFTVDLSSLTPSETDPVFSASAASGITSTNISNWNTAYGWGNHASAGYLTTVPAPLTSFSTSAWAGGGGYPGYTFTGSNSRFGFSSTSGVVDIYADGNFYATDSSHLVWHAGNDGSGSGLDADLLDGQHAQEMSWGHQYTHSTFTNFNTFLNTNYFGAHFIQGSTNSPGHSGATQYYHQRMSLGSEYNNYSLQFAIPRNQTNAYIYYRNEEAGSASAWYKIRAGYADAPSGGTFEASGDLRAPIFYDSNNTGYYIDPTGTSRLNLIYADDVTTTSRQASPRWDTAFYVLQAQHWYGDNSSQDMYLGESGNRIIVRSRVDSPIFYDYNDTNSYFDSNRVVLRGGDPTVIFRDTNHNSAMLHCNSNLFYVLRGPNDSGSWSAVNGQWPGYWNLTNNGYVGGGSASFAGDVTANTSDRRLKENIKNISNAINKVKSINGVTFDWKDDLEEINYTRLRVHDVGVIAQEIQDVLPEAVRPAPFDTDEEGNSRSGDNYLTVQYEKIVPLLIEAIKEQQQQIEELKQLINK